MVVCFCNVYVVNIGEWGVDHPFLSDCLCGKSFRTPMIVKMLKRVGTYSKQEDNLYVRGKMYVTVCVPRCVLNVSSMA